MSQRRTNAPTRRRNTAYERGALASGRRSPYARYAVLGLVLALVGGGLVLAAGLHPYVAWVVGWSIATFVFYGLDKSRAQGGGGRIPELVLHGMALIGGFFGGWLGRWYFRHKTLHSAFLLVLILSTVLHAGIALWLFRA